ncbi:50S ribosomal protein L18 [Myxococcota bacterium]|nr:50S ribosomal protein L18 [Myxococcota bacterium]
MKENKRISMRRIRQARVRKRVSGTEIRPRLAIHRSTNHIYAQVINDVTHSTICACSTLSPAIREEMKGIPKKEQAEKVGKKIAELCKEKNVQHVVFDRGGFLYHGRVASLAKGAREGGLDF